MANGLGLVGCLMVVATVVMGAAAVTHNVGDSLGWTIPPLGSIAYSKWAYDEDFEAGDTLVFNWNGTHNVAKVSKADFDNCTGTNPIGTLQSTSPANFTLDSNGTHYYICTVDSHCSRGQKVAITIGAAAPSLTTSALSAVILALAMSFISHM